MVRVGLLTLVTSRVGSVTSTSFRVSFGDRRTVSGANLPVSSGTLPGHSSTTVGLSAPAAGQAAHNQVTRETAATRRFMVAPLVSRTQPRQQTVERGRSSGRRLPVVRLSPDGRGGKDSDAHSLPRPARHGRCFYLSHGGGDSRAQGRRSGQRLGIVTRRLEAIKGRGEWGFGVLFGHRERRGGSLAAAAVCLAARGTTTTMAPP